MITVSIDIEADGPIPGKYSMISFGAVVVEPALNRTFYGQLRPISEDWIPTALKISGHTRAETLKFEDPINVMKNFANWLQTLSKTKNDRLIFVSDNNGFDWMFMCWYFHMYYGKNPFGHSSTNIGSLFKGIERSMFKNFKHLRTTKHTHHPVDDAKGNAEALLEMKRRFALQANWKH